MGLFISPDIKLMTMVNRCNLLILLLTVVASPILSVNPRSMLSPRLRFGIIFWISA